MVAPGGDVLLIGRNVDETREISHVVGEALALGVVERAAIRRALSWALVAALCVAALTAIGAVLTGDFDETDVRVIVSSVGFGVFSVAAGSGASLPLFPATGRAPPTTAPIAATMQAHTPNTNTSACDTP